MIIVNIDNHESNFLKQKFIFDGFCIVHGEPEFTCTWNESFLSVKVKSFMNEIVQKSFAVNFLTAFIHMQKVICDNIQVAVSFCCMNNIFIVCFLNLSYFMLFHQFYTFLIIMIIYKTFRSYVFC